MKDRDYLWCLAQDLLDREEALERLCPECRAQVGETRCPDCGKPYARWGEGAVNAAFDLALFEERKGGGA